MKVLLLFPPCWHPMMPHLALPSLTAYLRSKGLQVIQRDLNLEFFDEVLSKHHLTALIHRLERKERQRGVSVGAIRESPLAMPERRRIAAEVEQAKATVRSSRFYESAGLEALLTLTQALTLASAPYYPSALHFTGYDSAYPVNASQAILAAVRDREHNVFYDIFQRVIVPQIAREQPDLVGISITSDRQVIAGFTLAYLIKEAGLQAHVTLGGKMMTCWRDLLPDKPQLFSLCDSAVIYAGEMALLRLAEALGKGKDLSTVPNLLYREGHRIRCTAGQPAEPLASLPPPDFEGLPWRRYLAPEPVLPVSTSRGCYWHRCAFCNVGYGESQLFAEKPPEKVHEEMLTLARRWGVRHFFFSDEAVSPRMLKALSRRLIGGDTRLNWTCAARFEPSLDAQTLQQMARAGCKMLMFGLESGAPRILQRMQKGTSLQIAKRILKEGAEAGIWNHVFLFFGFPGETAEEAEETMRFFRENSGYIHSASSGTFMLERHSGVEASPQSYDVSRLIQRYDRDLAYYYDYEVSCGISAEEAERIEGQFLDSLPEKKLAHLYYHDIYRFLYACQFDESQPFPTMLQADAGDAGISSGESL